MSKSCYLCFEIKRILVELIEGINQSQNQRKVSCTRAKTYARTSEKLRAHGLKVMRAPPKSHASRSNSHACTSRKSRALEWKIPCTRAGLAHANQSHAFKRKKEIKKDSCSFAPSDVRQEYSVINYTSRERCFQLLVSFQSRIMLREYLSIPSDHTSKYKPRSRVLAFIDAF